MNLLELKNKELSERKREMDSLKSNLDMEINMNISIYNKMKGTPVYFNESVFQLVHIKTMKFLNLNKENPNDLL